SAASTRCTASIDTLLQTLYSHGIALLGGSQMYLRYILVLASLSLALFAQGVTGSFTGTVKDSSGAVVPNALVKVRSVDSGREWQNTGNESGIYYIPALPPGQYIVSAEVPGFKRLVT